MPARSAEECVKEKRYGYERERKRVGGSRESCPDVSRRARPGTYLVDPASSHMLVSKIKPCMSKYKLVPSETADGSLNQLWFIGSSPPTWITVVILELIHASKRRLPEGVLLLGTRPARLRPATLVNSG